MMKKLSYLFLALLFMSTHSKAVEVTYSTFKISKGLYGVYANITFESEEEKTVTVGLEVLGSKECSAIILSSNEKNPFFIKKYLIENIEEIDLYSSSNLFWVIKDAQGACIEQAVNIVDIKVNIKKFDLSMESSLTKPLTIDEIKIDNLQDFELRFPVKLNDFIVNKQLTGAMYWGEVDNFSEYGRLYFKFVWDGRVTGNQIESISGYDLICLNNEGKSVTNFDYVIEPILVKLPSTKDQINQLVPFVFSQGADTEFFISCEANIEYQYKGKIFRTVGTWFNNQVN